MSGPQGGPLTGQRVLLVEDEFLIAMAIEACLVDAGATVVGPAKSVAEASARLAEAPTLAVLDYRLARDETSLPVARDLAARGVPFLFHTGNATPEELHAQFANVPVLTKPCAEPDMIDACAALIGG